VWEFLPLLMSLSTLSCLSYTTFSFFIYLFVCLRWLLRADTNISSDFANNLDLSVCFTSPKHCSLRFCLLPVSPFVYFQSPDHLRMHANLSALEVCSCQGAIQIYVYLTLPNLPLSDTSAHCSEWRLFSDAGILKETSHAAGSSSRHGASGTTG